MKLAREGNGHLMFVREGQQGRSMVERSQTVCGLSLNTSVHRQQNSGGYNC